MIVLNTKGLSVGYEEKVIVDDININLKKGEVLCLLGPNGAGKTTILRTLSKLLSPIKGTVYIQDLNLSKIDNKELSKKMSVVLTNRFTGGLMTAFQVAAMGRYPYTGFLGYLSKSDIEKTYEALREVSAEEIADSYYDELSDGQKQKILVARALVQEPEVIVLDEPTTHLDIKHRLELIDILKKLTKEKGITVILSLHEIDIALKSCDKVMLVNKGKIISYGAPEEVVNEEIILKLYSITEANFNNLLGSVELSNKNKEEVFVIGGGGTGAAIYRVLTRNNIGICTGVIHKNDVDYEIARTMGLNIIHEEPFKDIKEKNIRQCKEVIEKISIVIDSGAPIGDTNKSNLDLINYALKCKKKIITFRAKEELNGVLTEYNKNIIFINNTCSLINELVGIKICEVESIV